MKKGFLRSTDILNHDFEMRKNRNPKYSKRAYAKHLNISSGRVVDLLNGKGHLSLKMAKAIAAKLSLTKAEKDLFLTLLENEKLARPDKRKSIPLWNSRQLRLEEFAVISDWEYFAFMALVETTSFKNDIGWISRKLNITEARTQEVIAHLKDKNFITADESGKLANNHNSLSTLTDIPSDVLRKANIECIEQGIKRIHTVDVDKRDVTSLTFPVAPEKIPELKVLIREFKMKAAALMNNQPTSEVYNLNIQLVPVTALDV